MPPRHANSGKSVDRDLVSIDIARNAHPKAIDYVPIEDATTGC
jgi:hypothetical protein